MNIFAWIVVIYFILEAMMSLRYSLGAPRPVLTQKQHAFNMVAWFILAVFVVLAATL